MIEVWKPIPKYEGLYEVSNLGRVKSLKRKYWNGRAFILLEDRFIKENINSGYKGFNLCNGNRKYVRTHRIIAETFGLDCSKLIDHINGNKLDNRLENLRSCNKSENGINSQKRIGNFTSIFKGVSFDKSRNKWSSEIHFLGKKIYIGRFENENDAALAYNEKAISIFGDFAVLNKV